MNVPINDGGPAFPFAKEMETISGLQFSTGMSLRDYFAGQAMAAMISNPDCVSNKQAVASHAYGYADAMIAAREVRP